METMFWLYKMKIVLKMDGDDGRTLWMFLMPLTCKLKNSLDGKFCVICILAQLEK